MIESTRRFQMKTFTIIFGGTQGEGMVSAGAILSKALSRSGYYTYTHRTFASRIKGGHTRSRIEITPFRNAAASTSANLIVAFDEKTSESNFDFSTEGFLRIIDDKIAIVSQNQTGETDSLYLPFSETAKNIGNKLTKSTVALGLICRTLALSESLFKEVLAEKYKKKGETVVGQNLDAFEEGLLMANLPYFDKYEHFKLDSVPNVRRPVMTGNYALALGALAGGCRFVSAYPITPASEIMEYLSAKLPTRGGLMVQTEDEIAAITMAIGASYGGVRSMTSTSGPGLSLMMEGLGLAAMAELPLVVVDSQRVGPSTGLPTRIEQSDFDTALYGGHGEYPSITLAPYNIETCFSLSRDAFYLADEFSCPVFVMSDLGLGLFSQTVDPFLTDAPANLKDEIFPDLLQDEPYYPRYAGNSSTRPAPGTPGGIHYTTGLEHGPLGAPDNSPENRIRMMKRRMEKFDSLSASPGISLNKQKGRLLMISTGSVYGICEKAIRDLGSDAVLGALHRLKPFPENQFAALSEDFESILIVEYNYNGQLFELFKKHITPKNLSKLHSLRKFSGEPFTVLEIIDKAKELM
jgi:2-oxoglutarate ferredoxin oxidoreductase subunit alpha